ncbi:MAG TPA: metalloregulator ArsR/SmtB family transcription factor [Gaiellaceae bacterium]|jgi:ArsR family transcriptional regulator|nr:metalloregulator ArsR/SmtB family transcription factor [Gaiellaceae bacterium]
MKKIATIPAVTCCAPGAPPLPRRDLESLSARFKALADPTRVAIVNCLAGRDECCVCELQNLGVSQPTVSHHLKILREAGLIEVARKRGTWVYYRLVPEAVEALAFALGGAPRPELVLGTAAGSVAR